MHTRVCALAYTYIYIYIYMYAIRSQEHMSCAHIHARVCALAHIYAIRSQEHMCLIVRCCCTCLARAVSRTICAIVSHALSREHFACKRSRRTLRIAQNSLSLYLYIYIYIHPTPPSTLLRDVIAHTSPSIDMSVRCYRTQICMPSHKHTVCP
jgi:hypothetical protein